ncbi:5'-nucleotidase [Minicystis rosea]|nr:5'-nucleotidase [Minicystis rosea]
MPAGTATATQKAGDCHKNQCDGAGKVVEVVDDSDPPSDDKECTTDSCISGVPSHTAKAVGTSCGAGQVCDLAGNCVGCNQPIDCGTDTACKKFSCNAGVCNTTFPAAGTPVGAQVSGDCHKSQCDGAGAVVNAVDDTDVPDDGKTCTVDACSAGVPSHVAKAAGTPCGTNQTCDAAGNCIACTKASDCGTDTACKTFSCDAGICNVTFAAVGTPVGVQVAGDCRRIQCDGAGTIVDAIDDTDASSDGKECTVDSCMSGVPVHIAKPAGVACGNNQVCDLAGNCVGCNQPSDCGADTACKTFSCNGGTCSVSFTSAGTAAGLQVGGDCHKSQCDGAGAIVNAVDDTDVPVDDNNPCTVESCSGGTPQHVIKAGMPVGMQVVGDCHRKQCDASGAIANVVDDTDVPAKDGNTCTTETCANGVPLLPNAPSGTKCDYDGGGICNGNGQCMGAFTIVRVGGNSSANTAAVSLDTYVWSNPPPASPAPLYTHPLPTNGAAGTTTANPLTLSASAPSEGGLSRSGDGRYLTLAGYAVPPGSSSTSAPRVVARVDTFGLVNTTTSLGTNVFAGSTIRGATSVDGSGFWASGNGNNGSGGVWYAPLGAPVVSQILTNPNNARMVNVFKGQLYGSASASPFTGVFTIRTANSSLPTLPATATMLPGSSAANAYGFMLLDESAAVAGVDTLYVTSDSSVQRWAFDGASWSLTTTYAIPAATLGVTGWVSKGTGVTLIVTTFSAAYSLVIPTPGAAATANLFVSAATGTSFRGVALAPVSGPEQ